MPNAAAGLAQVTVGDPDELMTPGLQQHPLEQSAVCGFVLGAKRDLRACAAQLLGQLVAELLEFAEAQEPRSAGGSLDVDVDNRPRERRREGVREVAVQPGDLRSQGAPCAEFVRRVDEREPTESQSVRAFVERNHAVRSS